MPTRFVTIPQKLCCTLIEHNVIRMKPDHNYYLGRVLPGGYRIEQFIGEGAFAYVYQAINTFGEKVAVKIQYNFAQNALKRFSREIKVLKHLPPNKYCVRYIDHGTTMEELPFLVMEYVDGWNLQQTILHKPVWTADEAGRFMVQLCDAFGNLHALGLVHRDIKPDNIMFTQTWQVKLLDLGFVKDAQGLLRLFEKRDILEGREFADDLDQGILAGTPEYMAPEQFSDPSESSEIKTKTDTMTDVYSLGLIFYQLLTGMKLFPFTRNSAQNTYAKDLYQYLNVRTHQQDNQLLHPPMISVQLWSILKRSLRFDPKLRQRDAIELGNDIKRFLETGEGIGILDEEVTSAINLNALYAMAAQFQPELVQQGAKSASNLLGIDDLHLQNDKTIQMDSRNLPFLHDGEDNIDKPDLKKDSNETRRTLLWITLATIVFGAAAAIAVSMIFL